MSASVVPSYSPPLPAPAGPREVLSSFLRSSSIVGVSYLTGAYSIRTRTFWALVHLLALAFTLWVLAALLRDWSSRPVVTNLQSAAVPIGELEYPTVTVCPRGQPVDRWAFLEQSYNQLLLPQKDCSVDRNAGKGCSPASKRLLEDFSPFLTRAGDLFLSYAYKFVRNLALKKGEEGAFKEMKRLLDDAYDPVKKKVLPSRGPTVLGTFVGDNETRANAARAAAAEVFAEWRGGEEGYRRFSALLEGKLGLGRGELEEQYVGFDEGAPLNLSQNGEQVSFAARLLLRHLDASATSSTPGLGTLLSHIASSPLFPRTRATSTFSLGGRAHPFEKGPCHFDHEGKDLHDKFSAVSRSLGLGGGGGGGGVNISAFELPSLLGQRASSDLASSEPAGIFFHPHFNCQNPLYANARSRSEHLGKCFRAWKGAADNDRGAAHPCRDRELAKSCCTLTKLLNKTSLASIMTVMKASKHLGHSLSGGIEDLLPDALSAGAFSRYQVAASSPNMNEEECGGDGGRCGRANLFSQLPHCYFRAVSEEERDFQAIQDLLDAHRRTTSYPSCERTVPTTTIKGLCQAFHAPLPSEVLLPPSSFLSAVESAFAPELKGKKGRVKVRGTSDRTLAFALDRHSLLSADRRDAGGGGRSSSFIVSVGSAADSPLLPNAVVAEAGRWTEILVAPPSQLVAHPDLEHIGVHDRNCRLPNEKPHLMVTFRNYSQSLCRLECGVFRARSRCGCTPWEFPIPPDDQTWGDYFEEEKSSPVCDHLGSLCFRHHLQQWSVGMVEDVGAASRCSSRCLPDCEKTTFAVSRVSHPIDEEEVCGTNSPIRVYADSKLKARYSPLIALFDLFTSRHPEKTAWTKLDSDDEEAFCRQMLREDIALVSVRLTSDFFVRSEVSPRRTPADKVSQFGGVVGLCSGMCALTLLEVMFWAGKAVRAAAGRCKGGKDSGGGNIKGCET